MARLWSKYHHSQSQLLQREKERQISVEEQLLETGSDRSGSDESLLEHGIELRIRQSHSQRCNYTFWLTALNAIMLAATIVLNSVGQMTWNLKEHNTCVKETSAYSPVLDAESIRLNPVKLNGTLWPGPNPGFSRKIFGDPEAEDIWESFELAHTFPLSRDEVLALGKDPETAARFPDEVYGFGDEAYIGSLDVQHKLHCLNELRKMTFLDYGDESPQKKSHGKLWWIHLRHCVDMLTQDMICHSDADVITYNWMDTQDKPFPDFSINRKCRSLEDLLVWRDQHRTDPDLWAQLEKPSTGMHMLPAEPGYYALFGFHSSTMYPNGTGYSEILPDISSWFGIPPKSDKIH